MANLLFAGLLFPFPWVVDWLGSGFLTPWRYNVLALLCWGYLAGIVLLAMARALRVSPRRALRIRTAFGLYLLTGVGFAGYSGWREYASLRDDLGLAELPLFVAIHHTGGETWTDVVRFYACRIRPEDAFRLREGRPFSRDDHLPPGATSRTPWLPRHVPFDVAERWSWVDGHKNGAIAFNAETNQVVVTFLSD